MRRSDFEKMVREMVRDVPAAFLDGVTGVEVTGKTIPHPLRRDVFTMGECVPHAFGADDEGASLRSTVFLHYGSFAALARDRQDFDWRHEAWETLTHELRHHLEWRARIPALEALDDAVEANYARVEGDEFEALFFLDGELVGERGEGRAESVYKVEDDVFVDVQLGAREWKAVGGTEREFAWHGRAWRVRLPAQLPDVLFLSVSGVEPEPAGELVLVVRRRPGARDLLRRTAVGRAEARVTSWRP
jgi:hypothetical protein